jgi:ABC-type lipoprotein export system ATPase subunit
MPISQSPETFDLAVSHLRLHFPGQPECALEIAGLAIRSGEMIALSGPSGSGKTTLLHLLCGLLLPNSGSITYRDKDLTTLSESHRDAWRRAHVGLVFQDFHLIPELGALDNIMLPTTFGRAPDRKVRMKQAKALAERLGVGDLHQNIGLLSRGEQQRVAVIRALVHRPRVILADEPTASLDAENAASVGAALVDEARAIGATLIVATHDAALGERLDRKLSLKSGRIISDEGGASQ